ncbi:MAG: hypothetical protein A2998_01135 [Candidatus Staskawiczbacteria bacterium RIFCSPLOWO2_01_FULL_37_25b]|uniref:Uncharacterized protein n=2 Tax=Candidatus Staskawicziibacteriota TaxID=1817916 RepID=A0A1G2HTK6_9BACT|nr:MAG: hypothetical protein A2812_02820 [Candidatus Staskawiczbacteria bacterium RIFCSPHIGHO2_01_FULL_36_16]OGZ72372.1 MAG: hypothetical protein A2998_01135 [Candidatus Staskawiczbacteria bacterium RIFCSPLOWO2_01_FULL_37_25b]
MNLPETIQELEEQFDEIARRNPRDAAEVAFALASHYFSHQNPEKGRAFAQRSIELFDQCGTNTAEECGARHLKIGGICMPDMIHAGLVRFRLEKLWGEKAQVPAQT